MIEIFRLAARNGADLAVDQAVSGGVVDDRGAEFEEAEAQEAVDEGPEVGDVNDDDGGGGFAGVPVQVGEVSEAASEVVVTIEDCAKDLMRFEN